MSSWMKVSRIPAICRKLSCMYHVIFIQTSSSTAFQTKQQVRCVKQLTKDEKSSFKIFQGDTITKWMIMWKFPTTSELLFQFHWQHSVISQWSVLDNRPMILHWEGQICEKKPTGKHYKESCALSGSSLIFPCVISKSFITLLSRGVSCQDSAGFNNTSCEDSNTDIECLPKFGESSS